MKVNHSSLEVPLISPWLDKHLVALLLGDASPSAPKITTPTFLSVSGKNNILSVGKRTLKKKSKQKENNQNIWGGVLSLKDLLL